MVPVAGETGAPTIVIVNVVPFGIETIWNSPLYSGWFAPAMMTHWPTESAAVDATCTVAVAAARVIFVTLVVAAPAMTQSGR